MGPFIMNLFDWLPPSLSIICCAVVTIFFVISFLHLIAFILDIIPFL